MARVDCQHYWHIAGRGTCPSCGMLGMSAMGQSCAHAWHKSQIRMGRCPSCGESALATAANSGLRPLVRVPHYVRENPGSRTWEIYRPAQGREKQDYYVGGYHSKAEARAIAAYLAGDPDAATLREEFLVGRGAIEAVSE